jgi:hypothetical protein
MAPIPRACPGMLENVANLGRSRVGPVAKFARHPRCWQSTSGLARSSGLQRQSNGCYNFVVSSGER